ncbi:MAG TPA: hypothetical protein VK557_12860 [Pyrinomonadaceae bacterium]|nr:hypothetical protein [Pyrinomonadaceae bacterium]
MHKSLWVIVAILLSACSPLRLSPKVGKTQTPADWRPVTVGKVTIYLPPSAKEIVPDQKQPDSKGFETETLSLRIGRSTADSTALALVSNEESRPNEEQVSLDGKSSLITQFRLPSESGQNYVAVLVVSGVYADGLRNVVIWAKGNGPEDQKLARKIFLTTRVSP